jgi:signal transduction histidine kinase
MTVASVTASDRKPWRAIFRLLERDERVFAVLLAVVTVGGLAMLGLVPLRPRLTLVFSFGPYKFGYNYLVFWFGAYKLGLFALVTVNPRSTRAVFLCALGVDLLLVFALLSLTGAAESLFYLLFFPLVAVNAYYFGPRVGLGAALLAGGLYTLSTWIIPPWAGWFPGVLLSAMFGLPAITLGLVVERERRARNEVDRLNVELTGTLSRLQAAQQELLVAERMATVGRVALKVAHEVRNPISAIELNAEILQDIVRGHAEPDSEEASALVASIRDQVKTLDALTEEYLTFARFPRPHFEEESVNSLVDEVAEFFRPLATRQGLTVKVETDAQVPLMEVDRGLLRQALINLVKNAMDALSRGGGLTLSSRLDGESVELSVADTGAGITDEVARRLFEPFFTTKPQGTGLGLSIATQITEEHGGNIHWGNRPEGGALFTIRLPLKRAVHV